MSKALTSSLKPLVSFYGYDPTFTSPASFGKRLAHTHKQKLPQLRAFLNSVTSCSDFELATWHDGPSSVGLPHFISYLHKASGVRVEFDGLVFVSSRRLTTKLLDLDSAVAEAKAAGYLRQEGAEIPRPVWEEYSFKVSAGTSWAFMLDAQIGNQPDAVFAVELSDQNVIQVTMPTGVSSRGRDFHLLVGPMTLVQQIRAHDAETARYFWILQERLSARHKELLNARRLTESVSPVVPYELGRVLTVRSWRETAKYWTDVHRAIESIVRVVSNATSPAATRPPHE